MDATAPLRSARHALEADRPAEARDILHPLLEAQPGLVEARYLLARADAASGDVDAAREGFEAALAAAPGEALIWLDYAVFAHGAGGAADVAERAAASGLAPPVAAMVAEAAQGTGARAQGTGDVAKREMGALRRAAQAGDGTAADRILARVKRAGAAALVLAGQAKLRGGGAEALFRAALRQEPPAVDARLGLARALGHGGQVVPALAEARRAARAAPAWAEAQLAYARLALAAGLPARAAEGAEAALAVAPDNDAARMVATEAALALSDFATALTHAEARRADAKGRQMARAQALAGLRRSDEALEAYAQIDDIPARVARAQMLQSLGRADEAEAILRAVLAEAPGHGRAARALAYGTKLAGDDPVLAAMRAALPRAGADDARLLRYALARAGQGADPARAAADLKAANDATAARWPHDAATDRAEAAQVTGPDWTLLAQAGQGICDAAPIFVTGMPRSGTTLVESILSAHSAVARGGEMGVLQPALAPLRAELGAGRIPGRNMLTAMGDAYGEAAQARAAAPTGLRLTDKSIHSFVHMGAIRACLPRASIVVVHRDPRDTALSMWRNHFPDGTQRYTASAEGIAAHLALFRDVVATWRTALPAGSFHEVSYEGLLADAEGQTAALLAACGLDWDPACLDFDRQGGRVDTLSFAQVRQPIYSSSVGAWRRAPDEAAPLIAALAVEGLLPDDGDG